MIGVVAKLVAASAMIFFTAWAVAADTENAKDFPTLLVERECLDCDFSGLPLQRQSLLGVVAQRGDFTGANLSGADLRRADLRGAILRDVNFTGANLSSARWDAADLSGAIFCNTIMPDRSVSTAECIEGTWKSAFDGIAGGVLQIRPSGKPGYWEGIADGQVALRGIHRKGEGKYNAEIYLEIGDDSYMQKGWFPIGCKIDAGSMVCGKSGILTFEQLSADVSIAKAVQFKLPEEPRYTIYVYMLEHNHTDAQGTHQRFLYAEKVVFAGRKKSFDFNYAEISGVARWKVKGHRSTYAFKQPIKAALYKGTSKNPKAEYRGKVEGTTDNKGNYSLTLYIQPNAETDVREFRHKYIRRKAVFTSSGNEQVVQIAEGKDYTHINAVLNYESRRSDLSNVFMSSDHQQFLKNKKAGLTNINMLNSLIRKASAPVTAHAQLLENGFKLIEWAIGEPLPGTKKPSAEQKAKGELKRKLFWEKMLQPGKSQKIDIRDAEIDEIPPAVRGLK